MSWISVLLGAAAAMAVGMFWYSPLAFGRQWEKLSGVSGDCKNGQMPKKMIMGFVSAVIMSAGVHYFIQSVGALTYIEAFIAGAVIWACFIATTIFGGVLWSGKPMGLFFITASKYLVTILGISAIAMTLQ